MTAIMQCGWMSAHAPRVWGTASSPSPEDGPPKIVSIPRDSDLEWSHKKKQHGKMVVVGPHPLHGVGQPSPPGSCPSTIRRTRYGVFGEALSDFHSQLSGGGEAEGMKSRQRIGCVH